MIFQFAFFHAKTQIISPRPLSERIANYDITVKLYPEKKILEGEMLLDWKNNSPDTINELQFHLYMNAFKNTASSFYKESKIVQNNSENNLTWGNIDIKKMRIVNGENLINKYKFIQPDDKNEHDQTVISVNLSKSILPGKTINLKINFETKLPKIVARTGYARNYFLVGQWFPKIGVYEKSGMRYAKKGAWNCHQFHRNTEFYANFGVYNVDIILPEEYVVGATGILQNITKNNDNTKTLTYRAEDVIDFAWTASPHFISIKSDWKDVKINLLIQPEHSELANRHINSIKVALSYFDKYFGKYPYKNLTIVDPPNYGISSAGMEYPTFITAGSFKGIPEGLKLIEQVVIHEFGHQYFMGLLATNEFEEAWMDEGMNTYFETRIMDETYGEKKSIIDFPGISIGDFETKRMDYVGSNYIKTAESFRPAWDYRYSEYGMMSYSKPAVFLTTLEKLIGRKTMDNIFKTYYKRFKFKHPNSQNFIDIVNEIVKKEHGEKFGKNMNWFFDQVLYGTDICDYKLRKISVKKAKKYVGIFNKNEKLFRNNNENSEKYISKIIIDRKGEIIMPVEILIKFDNGEELLKHWDGKSRTKDFIFERVEKVVSAQIDPEKKILIDVNLNNNSKTLEKNDAGIWKYVLKFMFWLQNLMQTVAFLS